MTSFSNIPGWLGFLYRYAAITALLFAILIPKGGAASDTGSSSITDLLSTNPDFSLFTQGLKAAEMWPLLEQANDVQFFIATDRAMRIEGSAFLLREVLLARENQQRLKALLAHHLIFDHSLDSQSVYRDQTLATYQGQDLVLQVIGDGLLVGPDARLVDTIPASNGYLFIVDRLLWSPYQ